MESHYQVVSVILLAFLLPPFAVSEPESCQLVDIPTNVIVSNGELLTGVRPEQLIPTMKGERVSFESITYDTAPHRVLFILDMRHYLSNDARRAELGIVEGIVKNARSRDQFALLTVAGNSTEVEFSENRDALLAGLKHSAQSQDKNTHEGALDTASKGLAWFQAPQAGDAILLMTADEKLNQNSHASFWQILDALSRKGVRLFSFSLGPTLAGSMYYSFNGRSPLPSAGIDVNTESLGALTWGSGGYMVSENTLDPWRTYRLTDDRLAAIQREGVYMYAAIEQFYRFRILAAGWTHGEGWKLDLSPDARKKVPTAMILYPRQLVPCAARGNPPQR